MRGLACGGLTSAQRRPYSGGTVQGRRAFLHLFYCCALPVFMAALVSNYPKQNRRNYSNTLSVLRGSEPASPTALRVDSPAPANAQ